MNPLQFFFKLAYYNKEPDLFKIKNMQGPQLRQAPWKMMVAILKTLPFLVSRAITGGKSQHGLTKEIPYLGQGLGNFFFSLCRLLKRSIRNYITIRTSTGQIFFSKYNSPLKGTLGSLEEKTDFRAEKGKVHETGIFCHARK